jgi:hypothetical protein
MTLKEFKVRIAYHLHCASDSLELTIKDEILKAKEDESKEYLYVDFKNQFRISPLVKVSIVKHDIKK